MIFLLAFAAITSASDVRIELSGHAKGGSLWLIKDRYERGYDACGVTTCPGESAGEVSARLTQRLHSSQVQAFRDATTDAAGIGMGPGVYYVVGSETGFAVLTPPMYVTINYAEDAVIVEWLPEVSQKTILGIMGSLNEFTRDLNRGRWVFENVSGRRYIDSTFAGSDRPEIDNLLIMVQKVNLPREGVGQLQDSLRSRIVRIHVSGKKQEDLDNLPFYGNVQPNWVAWSPEGFEEGALGLSQGEKSEVPEDARKRAFAQSPDAKFYCQMFELKPGTSADGGVYRRYLGLLPGHRYRVYARFNTFEAKSDAGDWGLSFHACADPAGGGLDVEQLQGLRPLPDGASGPDAGLVTAFHRGGTTTGGKWAEVKTGTDGASADITIPEGSSSLSAWVRVKGAGPARFGMDWSALEDMAP